jgi:hypothetical protein
MGVRARGGRVGGSGAHDNDMRNAGEGQDRDTGPQPRKGLTAPLTQRRTTRRSPISRCRSQQRNCTSNKTARAHTLMHLQRVDLGHVVPGLIERQIRPVLGPLQLCSQRPTALRLLRLPPRVAIHQCESHTSSNAQQLREGRCHEKETKWVVTGRSDCSTFNRQTTNQAPATSQKP